jgi:hypothetical protein
MIKSTMVPQIIAMLQDTNADARTAAIDTIVKLAVYGMNIFQTTCTD